MGAPGTGEPPSLAVAPLATWLRQNFYPNVKSGSDLEFMVFGAMIVLFLIAEPNGLARLWATAKEKLRLWPFPY